MRSSSARMAWLNVEGAGPDLVGGAAEAAVRGNGHEGGEIVEGRAGH